MIFSTVEFNHKKFEKYLKDKTILLDFGCGVGIWKKRIPKKILKIFLFDSNLKLQKLLKKKYSNNKKILVIRNINEIKRLKVNTVIVNSVFQYVKQKEIIKLINIFNDHKIKRIFIMDIPKGGKLLEVILNILNYRYIFNIVSYIFNINYHKIKYYKHDYRFIKKTPYSWKMIDNFNNIKNRYGIYLFK